MPQWCRELLQEVRRIGARPRVLGHHYHLEHPESIRNAHFEHQGRHFAPWEGIPCQNDHDWGQADGAARWAQERIAYLD